MKKIVVAPLNWGLGHASRCIPIIRALQKANFQSVIASDGAALSFLQKEFPSLETLALPSYQIYYGKNLKWNLVKKMPHFLRVAKREQAIIEEYVRSNEVAGIISDNRFGVRSTHVASVYMTHQLRVRAGLLTPFTSFFHQQIIRKFDQCWIPDQEGSQLSGKLSLSKRNLNQKYIGVLSRFEKENTEKTIDILIILSGPEPNRSQLEKKLRKKFYGSDLTVCLVQGKIEDEVKKEIHGKFTIINFALSQDLETLINQAKMVICRSGYSSIMDLASLGKKALLIPTKGQNEQEYLAKYHSNRKVFEVVKERDISKYNFNLDLNNSEIELNKTALDPDLFRLFHGE